jgi:hypothetical protein
LLLQQALVLLKDGRSTDALVSVDRARELLPAHSTPWLEAQKARTMIGEAHRELQEGRERETRGIYEKVFEYGQVMGRYSAGRAYSPQVDVHSPQVSTAMRDTSTVVGTAWGTAPVKLGGLSDAALLQGLHDHTLASGTSSGAYSRGGEAHPTKRSALQYTPGGVHAV